MTCSPDEWRSEMKVMSWESHTLKSDDPFWGKKKLMLIWSRNKWNNPVSRARSFMRGHELFVDVD